MRDLPTDQLVMLQIAYQLLLLFLLFLCHVIIHLLKIFFSVLKKYLYKILTLWNIFYILSRFFISFKTIRFDCYNNKNHNMYFLPFYYFFEKNFNFYEDFGEILENPVYFCKTFGIKTLPSFC